MGGIALGNGVKQSGLQKVLGHAIRGLLEDVKAHNVVFILAPVVLLPSVFLDLLHT
jgi:di/tricarboxylate transporter